MMENLRAEQRQLLVLEPEADGLIQRVPALLHRLDLGDEGTGVAQLGDGLELVVGAPPRRSPLRR